MTIFQWLANRIRRPTPAWLKSIMAELQNIIFAIIWQIGLTYIQQIQDRIISIENEDIPDDEKFRQVFVFARKITSLKTVKDSALRLIIEALVQRAKQNNFRVIK